MKLINKKLFAIHMGSKLIEIGERGIRTLGTKNVHSISNRALSATQTFLLSARISSSR